MLVHLHCSYIDDLLTVIKIKTIIPVGNGLWSRRIVYLSCPDSRNPLRLTSESRERSYLSICLSNYILLLKKANK